MEFQDNVGKYRFIAALGKDEPEHFQYETELIYLLNGSAEVTVAGNRFCLKNEDIILINNAQRYSVFCREETLMCRLSIPYQLLAALMEGADVFFCCNTVIDQNYYYPELRGLLQRMLQLSLTESRSQTPHKLSVFYQIVSCLCDHFRLSAQGGDFFRKQDKEDERINRVIFYIEANYNRNISLNDLSGKLFLTNSYLSRYFKRTFGMNFIEYVNKVRLRHVTEDLLYTEKSIVRIALDNGFSNQSVLNRVFKDTYGMSPSAYKKSKKVQMNRSDEEKNDTKARNMVQEYLTSIQKGMEVRGEIAADVSQAQPYRKNWNVMLNIGAASDVMQASIQKHILKLRDAAGIRYIRISNVFSKEMDLRQNHDFSHLNFNKLDGVLDFIVENGLRPFIEFGQKPKIIVKDVSKKITLIEENPLFNRIEESRKVHQSFVEHIIDRYSLEEVSTWYFEIWDDERVERQMGDKINYFDVFHLISSIIKKNIPGAKVGGCGTRMDFHSREMLLQWKEQKSRPDFLSFYCYPYESESDARPDALNRLPGSKGTLDANYLAHHGNEMKEYIQKIGLKNCPLFVTEWNCTVSSRNLLNDSLYKGAYIIRNVIDTIGVCDVLGYWHGSDITSDYYDTDKILFGGSGLISKDGICKPAFFAYQFLNRLGRFLVKKGDNYIITTNGESSYYIVCCNCKDLNYKYYMKSEDEIGVGELEGMFDNNDSVVFHFSLEHVGEASYQIKHSYINQQYGSVLNEWKKLDFITNMRKEDVLYLNQVCIPHLTIEKKEARHGVLKFDACLEPNEIRFIHLYRKN